MSGDDYLIEYQRSGKVDLSVGIGGWVRRRLDRKAVLLGQYDRHALFLPRVFQLAKLGLDKPLVVLEIGCGNGRAISYHHPKIEYIAVDRGTVFEPELKRRGVKFYKADVSTQSLPLDSCSINLIVLNHLIEHIPQYEFFVKELQRVLCPGGVLYIRTPNLDRVKWKFWDDYTHIKPYTRRGLDQLMQTFGFTRSFMLYSDHGRITIDILTEGRWRGLLFSRLLGGKEIEAGYVLRAHK